MDFVPETPPCPYHPHYLHPISFSGEKEWNQACQHHPELSGNARIGPTKFLSYTTWDGIQYACWKQQRSLAKSRLRESEHHQKVTMSSSPHLSCWEESARQRTWGKCPSRGSTPTIIQTGFFCSGLLAAE